MTEPALAHAWDNAMKPRALFCRVSLPFPAAVLAGHATQAKWDKIKATKQHREWARLATLEVKPDSLPETGDMFIHVRFVPANNRGDRVNYPNRVKPYYDGLADALGVNDKRFVPSFEFYSPRKPGFVEMEVWA